MIRLFVALAISTMTAAVAYADPIRINGLYVNTFGDPTNQPLIFIHGGPGYNSFSFEASVAQKLANDGYYVVVYDQRGAGRSEPAKTLSEFTFRSYAKDLDRIIETLGLKIPILMGHSFGGPIALKFMDFYPGVAKELILVAAPVSMPQTFRAMINRAAQTNLQLTWDVSEYRNKMFNLAQTGQIADAMFGPILRYGTHINGNRYIPPEIIGSAFAQASSNGTYETAQSTPEEKTVEAEMNRRPDKYLLGDMKSEPMVGFAKMENYATVDLFNSLKAHRDHVFGIYGSDDGLFDRDQLDAIRDTLPKGHFQVIENASHAVFAHQRIAFVEQVERINRVNRASAKTCAALFAP